MSNLIKWANIPVEDISRAARFYNELLGVTLEEMPGYGPAVLVPAGLGDRDVAFNLLQSPDFRPSPDGVRIVFDAQGDIEAMAQRAEKAGGKIISPPEQMGPIGVFAQVMDTEGNMISLMA